MIRVLIVLIICTYIVFSPELFPRCACCHKIKPRTRFLFHKSINLKLTRKGNLSLCKRCCKKNNFTSIDRYKKHALIEKRMEYKVKYNL